MPIGGGGNFSYLASYNWLAENYLYYKETFPEEALPSSILNNINRITHASSGFGGLNAFQNALTAALGYFSENFSEFASANEAVVFDFTSNFIAIGEAIREDQPLEDIEPLFDSARSALINAIDKYNRLSGLYYSDIYNELRPTQGSTLRRIEVSIEPFLSTTPRSSSIAMWTITTESWLGAWGFSESEIEQMLSNQK